jgi:hypothetical protein
VEQLVYNIRKLRTFDHPDFHADVFHLVRPVGAGTACDDEAVLNMSAEQRIASILGSGTVRAFPVFNSNLPLRRAVCFTEASVAQLEWLIGERKHYDAWGIGFSKDDVFHGGGGPVLEVRGDQWVHVTSWPDHLQAMTKRFWPGADAVDLSRAAELQGVYPFLATPSEWGFEREWRIPLVDFHFNPESVTRLIVPDLGAPWRLSEALRRVGQDDTAALVRTIPRYVVTPSVRLK